MNLFFDTSALVKFFHEEEGTDIVTDLILEQNNEVWISELGRLEFISAVVKVTYRPELGTGAVLQVAEAHGRKYQVDVVFEKDGKRFLETSVNVDPWPRPGFTSL
ncbi:MAG: hypothetical protein BA872_01190 [Desulfobacterales bacterium C00003060]|nr:MAG: hypothetical protein BA872_01190 [Desulfobacterales bacterium C00003060]